MVESPVNTIVVSYFTRPSPPALANHRRYAAQNSYDHRLIDVSASHTAQQLTALYKYESLLLVLSEAPENALVLLLTENAAIVTPTPLERLMAGRDRLLTHSPGQSCPFLDVQIWRNTPDSRLTLRNKKLKLHCGGGVPPDEWELMSDCADMDYMHQIDGVNVIVPAGANFDPVWARQPTFAISMGDPPIDGDFNHQSFPRLIWRSPRFNDALLDHINHCHLSGAQPLRFAAREIDSGDALSVHNAGAKIAFVMLYTRDPRVAAFGQIAEESFKRYCDRHGHALYIYRGTPDEPDFDGAGNWYKPIVLRRAMEAHEWVVWVDADTMVADQSRPIAPLLEGRDRVLAPDLGAWPFNSGVMAFRNTPEHRALFDDMIAHFKQLPDKSSVYASEGDQFHFIGALRDRGLLNPEDDVVSFVKINTPWMFRSADSFIVHYYGMWFEMRTMMMAYDDAQMGG